MYVVTGIEHVTVWAEVVGGARWGSTAWVGRSHSTCAAPSTTPEPLFPSGKAPYRQISWSLNAARLGIMMIELLWNRHRCRDACQNSERLDKIKQWHLDVWHERMNIVCKNLQHVKNGRVYLSEQSIIHQLVVNVCLRFRKRLIIVSIPYR